MVRKKLSEDEKRKNLTFSVNITLNEKLEKYMMNNGYFNKSKYIEKLIKDDLKNRGEQIE